MNNNNEIEMLINAISELAKKNESEKSAQETSAPEKRTAPEAVPQDNKKHESVGFSVLLSNPELTSAILEELGAMCRSDDDEPDGVDTESAADPECPYDDDLISDIEERLESIIALCHKTMDEFYEYTKTREYRNVTLNYPRTMRHLLSIADAAYNMRDWMNNINMASGMLTAIDAILDEYVPDALIDLLEEAHEKVNNFTAVIAPQYEMMEAKSLGFSAD